MRALPLLLLCFLLLPAAAWAHDPMLTGVLLKPAEGGLEVVVTTHRSRLRGEAPERAIPERLRLYLDGEPFRPAGARIEEDRANDTLIWSARTGAAPERVELRERMFPEDPFSRTLLTWMQPGQAARQAVLNAASPSAQLDRAKPEGLGPVLGRFLHEGIVHIFGGLDHVLFALGLLLRGGRFRQLVKTITAFTLAHSITLSLAATGLVSLPPRLVEPVIALSIVAIAVENLRPHRDDRDFRPWLAFGFGLIHGFGFAGALEEVGLPRDALLPALGAFNLGVELGQLAIVGVTAPLLALAAQRTGRLRHWITVGGSLAIAAAGAYWCVERLTA